MRSLICVLLISGGFSFYPACVFSIDFIRPGNSGTTCVDVLSQVGEHANFLLLKPHSQRFIIGVLAQAGNGEIILGLAPYLAGHASIFNSIVRYSEHMNSILWGGEIVISNENNVEDYGKIIRANETSGYIQNIIGIPESPKALAMGRPTLFSINSVDNLEQLIRNYAPELLGKDENLIFEHFQPKQIHFDQRVAEIAKLAGYERHFNIRHDLASIMGNGMNAREILMNRDSEAEDIVERTFKSIDLFLDMMTDVGVVDGVSEQIKELHSEFYKNKDLPGPAFSLLRMAYENVFQKFRSLGETVVLIRLRKATK